MAQVPLRMSYKDLGYWYLGEGVDAGGSGRPSSRPHPGRPLHRAGAGGRHGTPAVGAGHGRAGLHAAQPASPRHPAGQEPACPAGAPRRDAGGYGPDRDGAGCKRHPAAKVSCGVRMLCWLLTNKINNNIFLIVGVHRT